ncbi:hypothetical protein F5050DRAFT_1882903 [Lentinula boryana]|uniref:Uncharacterized protein n=1 Tax=Lentinula boryana TaxID=40481 RepID=A0ABQ8PWH0_9AGAR|nr:hypothetical protein F5050DRAFT_1882903 [Lentinula boryana]
MPSQNHELRSSDHRKRFNVSIQNFRSRIEELRDTYRPETRSQSDQTDNLKKRLEESDQQLPRRVQMKCQRTENDRLNGDVAKGKELVKDEEDKRMKAISLLQSVRQKLQERDCSLNVERDRAIADLRAQLDKELVAAKERHEKELAAVRADFEHSAVVITAKATFDKELANRNARITQLENSLNAVVRDKNKELERVSNLLGTATQSKAQDHGLADNLKLEILSLQQQIQMSQNENFELRGQIAQFKDNENAFTARETEAETQIRVLLQKLQEVNSRESQSTNQQ